MWHPFHNQPRFTGACSHTSLSNQQPSPVLCFVFSVLFSVFCVLCFVTQVNDTSLFVRIRKGWKELRKEIYRRGWDAFEVYACTCADRGYAAEVWRLLDPDNRLIPVHLLKDRMLCVPSLYNKNGLLPGIPLQHHKTLMHTCRRWYTLGHICMHYTLVHICIHLYTIVYMCIHLYTCVYSCINWYTCVYIVMHWYTFVCTGMQTYTFVYVRIHM